MEPNDRTVQSDEADAAAAHDADREPTSEEAEAADRAASDVDVTEVGKHFAEMDEIGANVEGEGAI